MSDFFHKFKDVLACPSCGGQLVLGKASVVCHGCAVEYPDTDAGQIDLRPRREKTQSVSFRIGTPAPAGQTREMASLEANPDPAVDFKGIKAPHHLTPEMLSYFPKASGKGALVLDLGCGDTAHRRICERAGFEYLGVDYCGVKAQILADGHCLPFKDNSFEFILCVAVLEHIRYPFVLMREVFRVMKPGGVIIGSSAFLEPFHGDSFYHHSHIGLMNTLEFGGFQVSRIAANAKWHCLLALSGGLFPGVPRPMRRALVAPLYLLHRLSWRCASLVNKKAIESLRLCKTSGAFVFVAFKKTTIFRQD